MKALSNQSISGCKHQVLMDAAAFDGHQPV
jgi:hypothetical protein